MRLSKTCCNNLSGYSKISKYCQKIEDGYFIACPAKTASNILGRDEWLVPWCPTFKHGTMAQWYSGTVVQLHSDS